MELNVSDVPWISVQCSHRLERCLPVARHTEVVAMNVDGMGQSEFRRGLRNTADDLPRSHSKVIDLRIQSADVARLL